jgi:hypothetical protein
LSKLIVSFRSVLFFRFLCETMEQRLLVIKREGAVIEFSRETGSGRLVTQTRTPNQPKRTVQTNNHRDRQPNNATQSKFVSLVQQAIVHETSLLGEQLLAERFVV